MTKFVGVRDSLLRSEMSCSVLFAITTHCIRTQHYGDKEKATQ